MIGWALRWLLVWCGLAVTCVAIIDRVGGLPARETGSRIVGSTPLPSDARSGPAYNTLVYPSDRAGHVVIEAIVDGAPLHMLVDTGASLVTLTPRDARAAGIDPGALQFDRRASTAGGVVPMAPVTLREIRIGQLSLDDVPAAVIEHLDVSLLGMSFLDRLHSYEMRDGRLTITW
ncbi:MAG TPA: TIGR02281 family clan AA aspartic protease [Stellaceae bacterium]|nr:TIGR02281 family clan AA aspartic protease [Stellaceae bacterium]